MEPKMEKTIKAKKDKKAPKLVKMEKMEKDKKAKELGKVVMLQEEDEEATLEKVEKEVMLVKAGEVVFLEKAEREVTQQEVEKVAMQLEMTAMKEMLVQRRAPEEVHKIQIFSKLKMEKVKTEEEEVWDQHHLRNQAVKVV